MIEGEIKQGDIVLYNKETSNYALKGDRYIVVHGDARMKVYDFWLPAVVYYPEKEPEKLFVREHIKFRQTFIRQ